MSGPPTVRLARNVAEKQRRDKLNSYINELANSVPIVANATKRLDKTSILRLSAAFLRLHNSPLKALAQKELAEEITQGSSWKPKHFNFDDVKTLMEAVDGFVIVVNSDQKIMYVSQSCEKYLGHQNIDMMGFPLLNFIHPGDVDLVTRSMEKIARDMRSGAKVSSRIQFRCRMKERSQPRTEVVTYQVVLISGSLHVESSVESINSQEVADMANPRKRHRDSALSPSASTSNSPCTLFKGFVQVIPTSPSAELSLIDANQEEYVTRLSLDGTLLYADHRISMITGFLPDEVMGKSAYGFILVPDHVISLFAHKLMLSNSNGTGIIVHRLKKRTGGYVYLQSAGCLQYDRVTGQVDHFICVSRHLHEDEGSKERQKFVKKFTPHIANDSPSTLYESLQLVIGPKSLQSNNYVASTNENNPNNSIVKSMKYSSSFVSGSCGSLPTARSVSESVYRSRPESSLYSTESSSSLSCPSQYQEIVSSPSLPPATLQPQIPALAPSPIMTHIFTPTALPERPIMPNFVQFPVQSGNLVYDPRLPIVNVRLPENASSIRSDGTFQGTQAITVAPLPISERSSIPSSFDHPEFSSQEFRSLLQPSHPILNQLRKHAMSSKFTMSSKSQQVMDNPDTTMNFTRLSQTNGPGELMTGSLIFGYDQTRYESQSGQAVAAQQQYSSCQSFPPPPPDPQPIQPPQQQGLTFYDQGQEMNQMTFLGESIDQDSSPFEDHPTSFEHQTSRLRASSPSIDSTSMSLAFLEEFARTCSGTTADHPPFPSNSDEKGDDFAPSDLFLFNNNIHDNNNTSSDLSTHDVNTTQFNSTQFESGTLTTEDSIEDGRSWCKKPRLDVPAVESPKQSTDSSS